MAARWLDASSRKRPKPPFESATAVGMLVQHITATPRPPHEVNPSVPQALSEVVLKAMSKDRNARSVLMMHESWHRMQAGLGLPAQNPAITHLDTLEGRYWLQLELRTLSVALRQRTEP